MKTKTYTIVMMVLFVPTFLLKAEGEGMRGERREMRQEDRKERMEVRQEARGEMKDNRAKIQADLKVKFDARRVELKANMDAMKVKVKDERAKKLDEKAKDRVEMRLGNIYKRLSERVTNLTRVDAGVTKRLAAYNAAQVNVASVVALQTSAQTLLAKARLDVEATKALSQSELNATTTKDTLRALVNTAETSLKTTHESYKKVLDALKALPKLKMQATTTATTTI